MGLPRALFSTPAKIDVTTDNGVNFIILLPGIVECRGRKLEILTLLANAPVIGGGQMLLSGTSLMRVANFPPQEKECPSTVHEVVQENSAIPGKDVGKRKLGAVVVHCGDDL